MKHGHTHNPMEIGVEHSVQENLINAVNDNIVYKSCEYCTNTDTSNAEL